MVLYHPLSIHYCLISKTVFFSDPVLCPHLLPPKASATLKYLLQHQPWNKHYVLQLDETEENADIYKAVNEQLEILDR